MPLRVKALLPAPPTLITKLSAVPSSTPSIAAEKFMSPSFVPLDSVLSVSIVTLPLMKTLPSISRSAPAASARVISPVNVIPSAASRVTAPISFKVPIAPIDIVSVVSVLSPPSVESALTVRLVAVPDPITELIETGPPVLSIVKF